MYNTIPTLVISKRNNGGVTDSIAGEPDNKHTAGGTYCVKNNPLNINADNNANYALAA